MTIESLLTRITNRAIEKGYGFRVDAYEMWNWGCSEYVTEYHTDMEKLIDAFTNVDGVETIHFARLDGIVPLETKLKDNGLGCVEDIECSDMAFDILAGDYFIRWINWGGNTGIDCLNDGSSELWDILEIDKITEDYEDQLCNFQIF